MRLISWTAWHSAVAAIGTSSRIRNAHNNGTNRNGFFTNCVKDLVSHLQLYGINIHFTIFRCALSWCSFSVIFCLIFCPVLCLSLFFVLEALNRRNKLIVPLENLPLLFLSVYCFPLLPFLPLTFHFIYIHCCLWYLSLSQLIPHTLFVSGIGQNISAEWKKSSWGKILFHSVQPRQSVGQRHTRMWNLKEKF